MARHRGRVVVSKVDSSGAKIKDFKSWRKNNPDDLWFDSKTEWEVWNYLTNSNIQFTSQPAIHLFDAVKTEEYQQPRQTKKAKKEGRVTREIKSTTQRAIDYTPDYYLPEFDLYIEVKGYADEVFKLRWKLFKLKGHKGLIVYSLKEFISLYAELKTSKYFKSI